MDKNYKWIFPIDKIERDEIWKNAFLTVDTNVLLDLYRISDETRKNLIDSLSLFSGRTFITRQAAKEFSFRRNYVRIKAFDDYDRSISELKHLANSMVTELNGICAKYRFIDKSKIEVFLKSFNKFSLKFEENILSAKEQYNKKVNENKEIIFWLKNNFFTTLDDEWDDNKIAEEEKIAKDRIINKIPPGFMDKDKDGSKAYGDYFLWKQIIEKCKKISKPIIFVSSEQKEDWWEIHAGKKAGLRPELLDEFWRETNQPLLAYSTLNFITFALERQGHTISEYSKQEISSLSKENIQENREKIGRIIEKVMDTQPSEYFNEGLIEFELMSDTYYFTISSQLEPKMIDVPRLECQLIDSPNHTPKYNIYINTGTKYDFNIHIKSYEFNKKLPAGIYTVKYKAEALPF